MAGQHEEMDMTNKEFEMAVEPLVDARPYQAFVIELNDGTRHELESVRALSYRDGSVAFMTRWPRPNW